MRIGGKEFDLKKNTYIMGILNVTPDSFSDGGRYDGLDRAIEHAKQMIQEGVDIIDVGGESTRPGHVQITDEEEIARVVPVIRKLKEEFDIPVSIDTYKSAVAAAAIEAGADLVNDIWGLKYDSKMAGLIAKTGVACCLMHNRENTDYQNFLADFMDDMKECVKIAKDAGIADDRIILDPGVGFGKTYEMNLEIIDKLEIMKELGYPVLLGTSRKSVIGLTLDLPVEEREEGTMVTTVYGVQNGCAFVRVHDVEKNQRAIRMTRALMREDLEVFANHGVFPEENTLGQKFVVSAVLFTDTRMAGRTDDLTASIHYGEVSAFITEFLQKNTYQLLERAAEELAEALLLEWDRIEKISIEIKKPWAPVRLPLKTVSVKIERGWHTAYIALGSNIGDSKMYLDNAVKALNELPTSKVEVVSEYLVTPPYGVTDQPDFLNGCLKLRTLLYPYELLAELNRIEKEAGRERIIHWGPRTLDLDIIFYDDLVLEEADLCIPHVEMHKRKFVLEPLGEIAPYKRHPINGKRVCEMLAELNENEN